MYGSYQHPERMCPKEIMARYERLEIEVRRQRIEQAAVIRIAVNADSKQFTEFQETYAKVEQGVQAPTAKKLADGFANESLVEALRRHAIEARDEGRAEGVDLESLVSHLTGAPRQDGQIKP